jgi:hypothetical protein
MTAALVSAHRYPPIVLVRRRKRWAERKIQAAHIAGAIDDAYAQLCE